MLYLVATPIGNLKDISQRAIDALKSCDYIASEDTRHTLQLLNALDIKKKLVSYHEHNKEESGQRILKDIMEGKNVCLVTDAGCPAISDPGEDLVKLMHENSQPVTVIPGACAAISALMLSPFSSKRFCFEGFPPAKAGERKAFFERLIDEKRTSIVYEAPHKLKKTLETARKILGDDRMVSLVKEITKIHETVFVGTLKTVSEYFETNEPKGEYVLVIEGVMESLPEKKDIPQTEDIEKTVKNNYEELIKNGFTRKDAMRKIAVDNHLSRNEVYSILLRILS